MYMKHTGKTFLLKKVSSIIVPCGTVSSLHVMTMLILEK